MYLNPCIPNPRIHHQLHPQPPLQFCPVFSSPLLSAPVCLSAALSLLHLSLRPPSPPAGGGDDGRRTRTDDGGAKGRRTSEGRGERARRATPLPRRRRRAADPANPADQGRRKSVLSSRPDAARGGKEGRLFLQTRARVDRRHRNHRVRLLQPHSISHRRPSLHQIGKGRKGEQFVRALFVFVF